MSEILIIVLLYLAGLLVFLAEIFIPSHGVLTVVSGGFLVTAVIRTFQIGGQGAGMAAVFSCLILLPSFAMLAVKIWPKTPIGRRIAPPNPVVTAADSSVPAVELSRLIGQTGRCVSPLRPVGICDVHGRRLSCVSQWGWINAGAGVVVVGVSGGNLTVIEQRET
jgi:membrane-bound ClpP family serine protease